MPTNKTPTDALSKLPEELKAIYKTSPKSSPVVEGLKVAAALKLWNDRDYRDVKFEVPLFFKEKTVFVKVLAKGADGVVVGVECASNVRLEWLRERIAELRGCLSPDRYIIAVFPEAVEKQAEKVTKIVDEVWVTGKNGTVTQMMFRSTFHKG